MEKCSMETLHTELQVPSMELVYRPGFRITERPKVSSSKMAYNVFRNHWNDDTIFLCEKFKVMCLNNAARVLGIYEVSSGGSTATVVDPKMIFVPAILSCATAVILAHNHPSQNLIPSQEDKMLTKKISEAGKFLDIRVHDHLIIGNEHYYSFADEGLL